MGHYLKGNRCSYKPTQVIVLDTETVTHDDQHSATIRWHTLRLGVARRFRCSSGVVSRQVEIVFRETAEFAEWLYAQLSEYRTTWLFAHNLYFDLRVSGVFTEIDQRRLSFDRVRAPRRLPWKADPKQPAGDGLCVLDDPPTILSLCDESGARIMACDTLNYFPVPLSALGGTVGLPKLDMPGDNATDDAWIEYCRRDVEIVQAAVCKLIAFADKHDIGQFRPTASGLAMSAFRHRFMRHKIACPDDPEIKAMEREAYYGGRTESFFHGQVFDTFSEQREAANLHPTITPSEEFGPLYNLDVTGLFAYAMWKNAFPVHLIARAECAKPIKIPPQRTPDNMIARCYMDARYASYPVRRPGQTVYAKGRFRTWLPGPELRLGCEHNDVDGVDKWMMYETEPIFTDYIDYFWRERKRCQESGDTCFAALCKMLMNGLYGKFGQRNAKWKWRLDVMSPAPWGRWFTIDNVSGEVHQFRSVGWQCQVECPPAEHKDSFPAIAAFVTSYARLHMSGLFTVAGFGNVYHSAVDSMIVNEEGYHRLVRAGYVNCNDLGCLRLIGVHDSGYFWGPNHYRLGDNIVCAGLSRKATPLPSGSYRQPEFDSARSLFTGGPQDAICERSVVRSAWTHAQRGTLDEAGWQHPFRLDETEYV